MRALRNLKLDSGGAIRLLRRRNIDLVERNIPPLRIRDVKVSLGQGIVVDLLRGAPILEDNRGRNLSCGRRRMRGRIICRRLIRRWRVIRRRSGWISLVVAIDHWLIRLRWRLLVAIRAVAAKVIAVDRGVTVATIRAQSDPIRNGKEEVVIIIEETMPADPVIPVTIPIPVSTPAPIPASVPRSPIRRAKAGAIK